MDKTTLDYLVNLGREANRVTFSPIPGGPSHVTMKVEPDGSCETITAEPLTRSHTAASLQAVVDFAKRFSEDITIVSEHSDGKIVEEGRIKCTASVWYNRDGVTCLIDDQTRRDHVRLPLKLSPQIVALQSLEAIRKPMKQAEFVLFLRTVLHDCLSSAGELLTVVRQLKFRVESAGQSEVQHGKSSIGRALTAELTGSRAIPEYVSLLTPIFANATLQYYGTIQCALEPDAHTETFTLIPLPLQIETAISRAEEQLGQRLSGQLEKQIEDGSVKLYYGTP
jgi:hypothetical protein